MADYLTLMAIIMLPWQPSFANSCNSAFSVPGHVLLDHVIEFVVGTSSVDNCLVKCGANSSCHSINWYSNTGLCQLNQGTHLYYPEGLVASDSSASYKLYSLHPMVTCSNRLCSNPADICLIFKNGIDYRCEGCNGALGMQDGRILNSQITASSFYKVEHKAWRGRLHRGNEWCWIAKYNAPGEWLQVDLINIHFISKLATQGRGNYQKWVTKYYLKYSQDGVSWKSYQIASKVKEFKGNTDMNTVVTRVLPHPLSTRFIRVVILEFNGIHAAMKIELYGCLLSSMIQM